MLPILCLPCLVIASAVTSSLSAALFPKTIVPPMFYSDIVKQSEYIVVGTVTTVSSRWDDGVTIRTYVDFATSEIQKGAVPGGTLRLRFDGGRVGSETIRVVDMPRLRVGGRYLLHVSGNGRHVSPIVGFYQGCFEIVRVNGRDVLRNHLGQDLIGIESDRFVFRAVDEAVGRDDAVRDKGPSIVTVQGTHVPARQDVEAYERALVAGRREVKAASVAELPASSAKPVSSRGASATAVIASPPPAAPSPASPQSGGLPLSRQRDATPLTVPKQGDRGLRLSPTELLQVAARVR